MADDTILSTDTEDDSEDTSSTTEEQYLQIENYLSEFETDAEKETARNNLEVYSQSTIETYVTQLEAADQALSETLKDHLNDTDDPHNTLVEVATQLEEYVRQDGTTPFTAVQEGITPSSSSADTALVTKAYVVSQISDLLDSDDKQDIYDTIETMLTNYAKASDVYDTDDTYSQTEVDKLLKSYVKKDGTVAFTAPQIGKDPTLDGHLATKRYADKILYKHLVEVDPHNFITTLNTRLASYAKLKDVYLKTQTYTRAQIDSIINSAVDAQIDAALEAYQEWVSEQLEDLDTYIKKDGSRVFTAPQQGVAATQNNELTTLEQVQSLIETQAATLEEEIESKECTWTTSGAVETTVGLVEEGTDFNSSLTLQQIMDAIFYGNTVSISASDTVTIGTTTTITLCVHGSTANIEEAVLYQGDEVIATYTGDDFTDGCIEVESNVVTEETTFTFTVTYSSGVTNTQSTTVTVAYPVFIGLLSKYKTASTITMDYLEELVNEDPTNNEFVDYNGDGSSLTHTYSYSDSTLQHIILVIPQDYPDLESITTETQEFGIDAFDVVEQVQLTVEAINDTVVYKIYVYSQALVSINQDVTFNFASSDSTDEDTTDDIDDDTTDDEDTTDDTTDEDDTTTDTEDETTE